MFEKELDNYYNLIEQLIDKATGNAQLESFTRERLYGKLAEVVSSIDNREGLFADFVQTFSDNDKLSLDKELGDFILFTKEYTHLKSEAGQASVDAKELLAAYDIYLKRFHNKKKVRSKKTRVAKAFHVYRQELIYQESEDYCQRITR